MILLDQTCLPQEERYLDISDWRQVAEAIRSMRVRGAPAIGIAAAYALALAATIADDPENEVSRAMEELSKTRPTAVNLFWAIERMRRTAGESEPGRLAQRMLEEANAIAAEQDAADHAIGEYGADLLPDTCRVLTHCNAGGLATYSFGTALGVIKAAHRRGKELFVWVDETRPLLQGARLTAWELTREGVPMALISDNMSGHLMSTGQVDVVITGADRIAANGDTANKIGTYTLAVLAGRHGIPFYVAAPLSTVDLGIRDGDSIPIEERHPDEVKEIAGRPITCHEVNARNFAFDVTPAELISAIINEKGVVRQPFEAGLRKSMEGARKMKAMILAAGLGTRLRPLTEEISKPMVPIVNRPVMEHIVELLRQHGFGKIYVNLHYHPDIITNHFDDGSYWGVSMTYSYEEELLGTAGGVKKLGEQLGGDTFLIISGDALTDLNLTELLKFHKSHGAIATLVITPVDDPSNYGVVITEEDGRIRGFQEKPDQQEARSHFANSGIYVFEPEVLEMIPEGEFYDFGRQLFPRFLEEGIDFYGYLHSDYWNDVGSLEEYKQGNFDALTGKVKVKIPGVRLGDDVWIGEETIIEEGVIMVGPICIGSQCLIKKGAKLFGPLVIGDRTFIAEGATLYRGIKWGDGYIGKDAQLMDSIVGWDAEIGQGATLLSDSVVGHRTIIGDGTIIHPSVNIMPGSIIEKNLHFTGEEDEE